MRITRRMALVLAPALVSARAFGADVSLDPRMADRSEGPADAKVVVQEWFSLTCTHCARFAQEVFPEVQSKLIATGKIRYVFKDYPLDQVALTAAMVARALPPERYEPFVLALLDSQARWAFARDVNPTDELAKMAALAGMPRDLFDKTVADDQLKADILAEQASGDKNYGINSTPTFVVNGKSQSGEMSYEQFAKMVGA